MADRRAAPRRSSPAARSTRCSTAVSTSRSTTSGRSRCRRSDTGSSSTSRARRKALPPRLSSAPSSMRSSPRPSSSAATTAATRAMDGSPTPPGPSAAERLAAGRPAAGTRQALLPSEVDPTVFDEAFLRQLERLLLLMRSPVRGGLKGGRRSVKRGQSVEFADYRDYAPGDDLRQLDWNVYARLEKLFVKLFVEEEDVTITVLIDASPSMAYGRPQKLLFAKRAAAALGYIGLASEDRVAISALGGRTSRRQVSLRGSGRVFRLLSNLSTIEPAPGPTDLVAAARHAAAQLSGRGVVV